MDRDFSETYEMFSRIGELCVFWAHLEELLEFSLWWLTDLPPEKGQVISGPIDINPLSRTVSQLAAQARISDDDKAVFKKAKTAIENMRERRNLAIHGRRSLDPETHRIIARSPRGQFKNNPQPMEAGELRQLCREVLEQIHAVEDVLIRHGVVDSPSGAPSPDKLQQQDRQD